MKEYVCKRCHYKTSARMSMVNHLQRKTTCVATYEDVSVSQLLEDLECMHQAGKNIRCECGKVFSTRNGLHRHQQHGCPKSENSEMQELRKKVAALEKELTAMRASAGNNAAVVSNTDNITTINNTDNSTTNNITFMINVDGQTIKRNSFGQESLAHITPEFLLQCLLEMDQGITALIKDIHFNPNVPENHNVFSKSLKYKTFQVYQDNKWIHADQNLTLDAMIDTSKRLLMPIYSQEFLSNHKLRENQYYYNRWLGWMNSKAGIKYYNLRRGVMMMVKEKTSMVTQQLGAQSNNATRLLQ